MELPNSNVRAGAELGQRVNGASSWRVNCTRIAAPRALLATHGLGGCVGEERSRVVKNGLLALGSAAVVAVYAAGYDRTQAAAQRFSADDTVRRPPVPVVTPPLPDASRPSNTTGRTRPLVSTSVGPGAIDSIRSPTVVAAEPSTAVATPSPTIAARWTSRGSSFRAPRSPVFQSAGSHCPLASTRRLSKCAAEIPP